MESTKLTITKALKKRSLFSFSGAGSCLEALCAGKPLLVVVNDKLMNNHQLELARQLHSDSHVLYCTCRLVFLQTPPSYLLKHNSKATSPPVPGP